MRYNNAYSLFQELLKRNLLVGFCIELGWSENGCKGIFTTLDSRISEPELLIKWLKSTIRDYLDEFSWYWPDREGFFTFDGEGNIFLTVDYTRDIREGEPEENIIEDLIRIIAEGLSWDLDKYDSGEALEYQYYLDLNLEIEDFESKIFKFKELKFRSWNEDPTMEGLINNGIKAKIKEIGLETIKSQIFDYFLKLRDSDEVETYSSLFFEISSDIHNEIKLFEAKGTHYYDNLKGYLENIPCDFELNLDEIEKNA